MVFWGWMDLLYMGIYATQNFVHGKIPIYSDVVDSIATSQSFGNTFPLVLTICGDIFYLTILTSGLLLIYRSRWGRYLSYVQIVPRLFFIIPSFFPLIYLFKWVGAFWITALVLVLGEALKVYSMARKDTIVSRLALP